MPTIKILCLTNSRKRPSGRCFAGKIYSHGIVEAEWARPISERPGHEISEEERRYDDGTKAQILDIIRIPTLQASPSEHQKENHTIDAEYYWEKRGTATWAQVVAAVDPFDEAFWSHSASSFHGLRDKVAESELHNIGSSLKLIQVENFVVNVRNESEYGSSNFRRRVRGQFTLNGDSYCLSITDPEIEDEYLKLPNGEHHFDSAILCISLTEVFNDYAYRVIASVITPDRF